MKKWLIVALACTTFNCFAQNAYYDALILSRHLDGDGNLKKSSDSVFLILDRYVFPDRPTSQDSILIAIQAVTGPDGNIISDPNPFLEIGGSGQSGDHRASNKSLAQLPKAIGDLNVTNFADGLAQFLIERSKEELTVAFFDRLKNDLKKYPELRVLFPNTAAFIDKIEAYAYASFIQTLREAFLSDLATLPSGMRNLRMLHPSDCEADNSKCQKRIEEIEKFFRENDQSILYIASTIIMDSLQTGANFPDILKAVAEDRQVAQFPTSNIANTLQLADIFSGSLRSKDPAKAWITRDELKHLRDLNVLKIYFGLIFQQCKNKNISFKVKDRKTGKENTIVLTSLLKPDDVKLYFRYLEDLVNGGTEINRMAKEIRAKKKADEKFTTDDYVKYLNTSVNAVDLLVNWDVFKIDPPPAEFNKVVSITRSAISIYYNIQSENYSSAISNAFIIVDETLSDNYPQKEKIMRYGTFMAAVVQADNAEEVKQAIQVAALPAGSASIKKNSVVSIGLNAYLGAFTGEEYLADKASMKWGNTKGIAAPIGLGVSTRFGPPKFAGALTGFVSVLDLGAVASYRMDDENTEDLPDLTFQNIFAPGFGLVYGFPKVPVSVGYLYQLGPALREINDGVATISAGENKRWYFFIGVDIPLVNFYTVTAKKK
jgi:hypothetical protein